MCGVLSYKTKTGKRLTKKEQAQRQAITEAMFLAMTKRGTDSTGLATADAKHYSLYKNIVSADVFIKDHKSQALLKNNSPLLIGHTRQATTGFITQKNAHPFQRGNIIGCHNGQVQNYLEIDDNVEVDSEVIFSELNKNGNNYRKTFKRLSGDFVILWTDTNELNSLYFVAHDNPLAIAKVPSLDTYFLCSYAFDLEMILTASGLKFEMGKVKENRVYVIDEKNKIYEDKIKFKKASRIIYSDEKYWEAEAMKWEKESPNEVANDDFNCCMCGTALTDRLYYNDHTAEAYCEICYPDIEQYGYGKFELLELRGDKI